MVTMTTVVIAEFGARWDEWAIECCGPGRQLIVLSQHRSEDLNTFRLRIAASLDRMQRSGVSLDRVVLVPVDKSEGDMFSFLVRVDLMQHVVSKLEQLGTAHC